MELGLASAQESATTWGQGSVQTSELASAQESAKASVLASESNYLVSLEVWELLELVANDHNHLQRSSRCSNPPGTRAKRRCTAVARKQHQLPCHCKRLHNQSLG